MAALSAVPCVLACVAVWHHRCDWVGAAHDTFVGASKLPLLRLAPALFAWPLGCCPAALCSCPRGRPPAGTQRSGLHNCRAQLPLPCWRAGKVGDGLSSTSAEMVQLTNGMLDQLDRLRSLLFSIAKLR